MVVLTMPAEVVVFDIIVTGVTVQAMKEPTIPTLAITVQHQHWKVVKRMVLLPVPIPIYTTPVYRISLNPKP